MKILHCCLLAVILWTACACSSSYQTLKTRKDPAFRLADYPTFGFYDIDASGDTVQADFEKSVGIIKNEIARNLQTRSLDEARDASLKINIAIAVKEKTQTRQTDFRTDGYPRYMGQRRYSWKSQEVPVGKYREGTIILDLVDANTNKLMWQGGAEGILPGNNNNFEERISPVIAKIISEIP